MSWQMPRILAATLGNCPGNRHTVTLALVVYYVRAQIAQQASKLNTVGSKHDLRGIENQ